MITREKKPFKDTLTYRMNIPKKNIQIIHDKQKEKRNQIIHDEKEKNSNLYMNKYFNYLT